MRISRRAIINAVQLIITVALFYSLFRNPEDRARMWSAFQNANKLWFLAGLGCYGIVVLLGSLRWHIVLKVQNIRIGYWRVLQLFMIGSFFNLFLLGTVGGDVVKVYYLLKETSQQKPAALVTVLMDRLIGLSALILLSAAIVASQYTVFLQYPASSRLFAFMATVLVVAGGGLLFSFFVTGFNLVDRLPAKFPGRAKLAELSVAYHAYVHAWKASLVAFVLSIGAHLSSFVSFYFAARAFTDVLTVGNILTVMPIVNTLTALPVTMSGMGMRESVFKDLLSDLYGVPAHVAVPLSLSGFLVIAAGSLAGGLVYLLYRPGVGAVASTSSRGI